MADPRETESSQPLSSSAPTAFTSLFLAHQRSIYRFLLALVVKPQDAEDLLQETAVILWSRFGEFRPDTSFFAWACQIARYKVLEYHRRRPREARLLDEDVLEQLAVQAAASDLRLDTQRSALEQCLGKLSARDRALLELRYYRGASGVSIAEELRRPAYSVNKSLGRIRRMLLNCLERALAREELEGGRR